MKTTLQKINRVVALFLVCATLQTYVLSSPANLSVASAATDMTSDTLLSGRLEMDRDKYILVNGNPAGAGTTIFSGAQLLTPGLVGTSVDLPSLGKLDVTPDTNLTLTFNKASVDVLVIKGDAFLTTLEGIKGSVTTPEGMKTSGAVPQGAGTGTVSGGLFGLGLPATVAIIAVGAAAGGYGLYRVIRTPCRRGRNPSPGVPRGRNDECRE